MSFGLGGRSGSFSGGNLSPFGGGSGGLSGYNIGGAANETASLDKYAAQVAWNQGRISDDAYIHALEKFAATTEKGTREFISAHADIADAKYTISRNGVVNSLNMATGTGRRISLWQDLITIDRRHLATMGANDNEQRRELLARIDSEQGSIRKEQWGDLVRRYNGKGVPIDRMLRTARRMAAASQGSGDHQDWLDQVQTWSDNKANETLKQLSDEWTKHPDTGGSAVLHFLDQRLSQVNKGTPQYDQLLGQRDQVARTIHDRKVQTADRDTEAAYKAGTIADDVYLQYWVKRLKDAPKGSDEQRDMKVKVYDTTFKLTVNKAQVDFAKTGDPTRLLEVYTAAQMGMVRGSSAWMDMQQTILGIQSQAYGTLGLMRVAPSKAGGSIFITGGTPPGGPGTGVGGFASQYDGSAFANQNCGYTSAAMLAWAAGVKGLSGGDMRWYAGDPSGPSMTSGMATAMERVGLGLETNFGYGLDAFRRRVANGEAAIVNGLYGALSGSLRLSSFAGAHSVTVTDAKKSGGQWWYMVLDPIARSKSQGAQWWPESAMRAFAWSGATNPLTGNSLDGVVMFATHNGRSVRRGTLANRYVPPQSFDTDAHGRSTIGKGGGTSRAEAGYMPPDFAARARGKEKASGTDEVAINTFLGAISKVVKPADMPQSPEDEAKWYARAKKLLTRYDGDVRRAGAQWFTGDHAPGDATAWSKSQVFYANAVGRQFGLTDAGTPTPAQAAPVATTPVGTTVAPPAPAVVTPGAPATAPDGTTAPDTSLAGYDPTAVSIADRYLAAIGAPNTPANTRAVITMLEALNGGERIDQLDPFHLRTDSATRFPGQTGLGPNGEPQFAGSTDPVGAAILAYASVTPAEVVGAFHAGDTNAVFDALAPTSPAFSGNNLRHTWNGNPGNPPLYGLPSGLDVPSSIVDNAKREPAISTLYNIDPTDPGQMDWYKSNVDNMKAAANAGATSWTFIRPDRSTVPLPFAPYLLVETAGNAFALSREVADLKHAQGDPDGAIAATEAAIKDMNPADMTVEGLTAVSETMHDMAAKAFLTPGGGAKAYRIYKDLQDVYAMTLGSMTQVSVPTMVAQGQTTTQLQDVLVPDINRVTNPSLQGDSAALDKIGALIEADQSPSGLGGALLWLATPLNGVNGFDQSGAVNADRGFVSWEVDRKTQQMLPVLHVDTPGNSDFIRVPKADPATGVETLVPSYTMPTNQQRYVQVVLPGGERAWQPVLPSPVSIPVYSNQPVSVSRNVSEQALPGQPNLGPLEQHWRTSIPGGMDVIEVPDPTDPDHHRILRYWSTGTKADGTQTWIVTPADRVPALIYTGKGTLAQDASGNITIDGNKLDAPTLANDFTPYGSGGEGSATWVKGVAGTGAPNATYVIKTSQAGMPLDSTLTDLDRYTLGGDLWPKGMPKPGSMTSLDAYVFAKPKGQPFTTPINTTRYGPVGPSSDITRSAAPDTRTPAEGGPVPGLEGQIRSAFGQDSLQPHGTGSAWDITALFRNAAANTAGNSVAVAAQQTLVATAQSVLAAAAERRQQEAIQQAARNRAAIARAQATPQVRQTQMPRGQLGPAAPASIVQPRRPVAPEARPASTTPYVHPGVRAPVTPAVKPMTKEPFHASSGPLAGGA